MITSEAHFFSGPLPQKGTIKITTNIYFLKRFAPKVFYVKKSTFTSIIINDSKIGCPSFLRSDSLKWRNKVFAY